MATAQRTTRSSALFDVLHADHERIDRALGDLLATGEGPQAGRRWRRLAVELTLHLRAEQEVLYDRLEGAWGERIAEARDEHARIEQLLADADAARPGTDFLEMVAELRQRVSHHVGEEEGELLPDAAASLGAEEQDDLVSALEDHKAALRTAVEMEFGVGPDVRWAEDVEEEREVGRPSRARSPKGGGSVSGDVSTIGARLERAARLKVVAAPEDLEARTVTELYDLARARGLEVQRGMGKQALLEALARAA